MAEVETEIGTKNSLRVVTTNGARAKDIGSLLTLIDELYSIKLYVESIVHHKYEYYEKDKGRYRLRSAKALSNQYENKEDNLFEFNSISENYLHQNGDLDYKLYQILNFPYQPNFTIDFIERITEGFYKSTKLDIISISKNSPIQVTLLGIPEIIEKIKDFIVSMVCLKEDLKSKKLDNAIKYEELRCKKLDNMYKFLELSKKPEVAQFILAENEKTRLLESRIDETMKVIENIEKIETIDINEAS